MSVFDPLIGKKIFEIKLSAEKTDIVFITDNGSFQFDCEGDCCSNSWFENFDHSEDLIGKTILEIDEKNLTHIDESGGNVTRIYGFTFKTSENYIDLEMRNFSNGYYGGWVNFRGKLK